mmetsp:Transcript_45579/g.143143  ORF Transcript_45579/g.143143 Transcript_45579/m.143143 type:complete len:353 (-) Transcript_45579:1643-2701(-)
MTLISTYPPAPPTPTLELGLGLFFLALALFPLLSLRLLRRVHFCLVLLLLGLGLLGRERLLHASQTLERFLDGREPRKDLVRGEDWVLVSRLLLLLLHLGLHPLLQRFRLVRHHLCMRLVEPRHLLCEILDALLNRHEHLVGLLDCHRSLNRLLHAEENWIANLCELSKLGAEEEGVGLPAVLVQPRAHLVELCCEVLAEGLGGDLTHLDVALELLLGGVDVGLQGVERARSLSDFPLPLVVVLQHFLRLLHLGAREGARHRRLCRHNQRHSPHSLLFLDSTDSLLCLLLRLIARCRLVVLPRLLRFSCRLVRLRLVLGRRLDGLARLYLHHLLDSNLRLVNLHQPRASQPE